MEANIMGLGFRVVYWENMWIMEKKMETTSTLGEYWGYIALNLLLLLLLLPPLHGVSTLLNPKPLRGSPVCNVSCGVVLEQIVP